MLGEGAFEGARGELASWSRGRAVFLLTDARVRGLHGAEVEECFADASSLVALEVPEGEAAKTVAEADRLWRAMLERGGKRDSRLVALGGGSVGDLGGFVAGCFLRGIEHALLPTTLLAQIDAAIGGKTAVDLPAAKNAVGLFRHPAHVVGDASWLGTLPRRERAAGLFEVVKVGFVLAPDLLARIERDMDALLAGEPSATGPIVAAAAAEKIVVVEGDPEEAGPRRVLNFGHTLGHALETLSGYRDLRHGEAVGYGMLFAARLAEIRLGLPRDDADRLRALVRRIGLPRIALPSAESLVEVMASDKKARADGLSWVLPLRLGAWRPEIVPEDELLEVLGPFLAECEPSAS